MFPFFLVFLLTVIPVIFLVPQWYQWFLFLTYSIFIGFRFEVGADWLQYINILEESPSKAWFYPGIIFEEPLYLWLNKITAALDQGVYLVNFTVAVIFCYGLFRFCQQLKNPYLGLSVAFPYLTTVVAMGYVRQAAAIGFEMLALIALTEKKIAQFGIFVLFAFWFHKSALFLLLIPLVYLLLEAIQDKKLKSIFLITSVSAFTFLFTNYILERNTRLTEQYIDNQMASSGALIRFLMNLLPALIFLVEYYRGMNFFKVLPKTYLATAWLVIFSGLLLLTGSTTLADRLGLYLIPIQVYVLGNLPYLFSRGNSQVFVRWLLIIVIYSLMVLWGWLTFADHAFAWVPYQFYPLLI